MRVYLAISTPYTLHDRAESPDKLEILEENIAIGNIEIESDSHIARILRAEVWTSSRFRTRLKVVYSNHWRRIGRQRSF